jgi:hypothetical protein
MPSARGVDPAMVAGVQDPTRRLCAARGAVRLSALSRCAIARGVTKRESLERVMHLTLVAPKPILRFHQDDVKRPRPSGDE